ncbi:ATP-dependent nuclease [Arthrobacter crusticola]|uniref:ATP-dependent nuclease n=1 Tax=Arthrobacter crusticola TaxID=2547960 RepID=UPI001404952C|nr:TOPRIM nucleotidyl transferase/hydrolase domain-containing protein [Arthrobacter crusticola]
MRLEHISITGFRSIESLEHLKIGAPTLLTGHNDAGKSASLDAVRFLLNAYPSNDRDRTYLSEEDASPNENEAGKESSVRPTNRVPLTCVEGQFLLDAEEQVELSLPATIQIRRRFQTDGPAVYERFCEVPLDSRLRAFSTLKVDGLKDLVAELGLDPEGKTKPFLLKSLETAAELAEKLWQWEPVPASLVKALPKVLSFDQAGQNDAEQTIKAALQAAYEAHAGQPDLKGKLGTLEVELQEKLAKDAAQIRQHIMDRCTDIGQVTIVPEVSFTSGLKATQVSVTAREGEGVRLGEAGAGRARRVALAVWEYTRGLLAGPGVGNVVLLYDEPDTHLDYAHQRDLMRLFREQCELPNIQMVIATHSMNLIDGVDISDVVHVRHEGHRTVIDRLADESDVGRHLGSVAASLGLRNTVLLHERLFVGVEGVSEQGAFPVLFKLSMGRHLESCGIALWACRNNEGATDFAKFLVQHDREVAFVIDADSKTAGKNALSDKRLEAKGLDPNKHALYIGNPKEFEDIFSDAQWANVANSKWPRADERPWVEKDISVLRKSRKFSDELLSMFKTESLSGPMRKQQLTMEMAMSLTTPEDVPEDLRAVFDELLSRAA